MSKSQISRFGLLRGPFPPEFSGSFSRGSVGFLFYRNFRSSLPQANLPLTMLRCALALQDAKKLLVLATPLCLHGLVDHCYLGCVDRQLGVDTGSILSASFLKNLSTLCN